MPNAPLASASRKVMFLVLSVCSYGSPYVTTIHDAIDWSQVTIGTFNLSSFGPTPRHVQLAQPPAPPLPAGWKVGIRLKCLLVVARKLTVPILRF